MPNASAGPVAALTFAALLSLANAVQGQSDGSARDGSPLSVYLMTMGPGDAVWERFGHNAIGIRNAATGEDKVYNWGMFSFDSEGFLARFLRGDMRYWMASEDAALTLAAYKSANRSVTIQELNFTVPQKDSLYAFVRWNELPENRFYSYDYFLDNCSTRVRDALDAALGGVLAARFKGERTSMTYRDHARRLMQGDPVTYTGIDIGLGRPTDRPISPWEEMFIPMSLQRLVRDVRSVDVLAAARPLVAREYVLFEAARPPTPALPAPRTPAYFLLGAGLAGVLTVAGLTRAAPAARVLAGVWCLACGLVGTLLLLLWVATDHTAAHRNANLLVFNPLWLVPAVAIFTAPLRRRAQWFAVLLACAVLALLWTLLPNQQDSARVLALALPLHAAVAFLGTRRRGSAAPRA
ncbi:MAG: lipoprotein N-acyltransferase Lnb domain-containing protein [Gemmatimonadaceae bacterium]